MPDAEQRAQAKRDEILDAAERVFAEKGYHESGIADIAAELGIGHGTFYRYFKNKRDIASHVLDRVVAKIAEVGLSEDPHASDTLDEYRAQTDTILSKMLAMVDTHPTVMRFFHDRSVAFDGDRLSESLDRYAEFTALFLKNGVDKGFLRKNLDIERTAQALVALIFEGTRRALRGTEDARAWVDAGVALMFDGLRAH